MASPKSKSEFFGKDDFSALVLPCYSFFFLQWRLRRDFAPRSRNCQKPPRSPGESRHLLFIGDEGEEPCRRLFLASSQRGQRLKELLAHTGPGARQTTRNVTLEKSAVLPAGVVSSEEQSGRRGDGKLDLLGILREVFRRASALPLFCQRLSSERGHPGGSGSRLEDARFVAPGGGTDKTNARAQNKILLSFVCLSDNALARHHCTTTL